MDKELRRGSVIRARLDDHNGKVSEHFAVVLTSNEDIAAGADLLVAGISTQFSHPIPSHWHYLENHPLGDCQTGLRRPCVVKASWTDVVPQDKVLEVRGYAPTQIVKLIKRYIKDNM